MKYTAHYRLPLFESADHPSWLGDWNETMNKIDECISDLEIGNIPSLAGLIERIVALENSVEADEQIISATTQALTTLVKKSNITLDFDSTHSYTVGELCFYEGDLYKCVVAHTGDWLSTDFTRTTIEQQINDVASGITPDFTSIYQMFAPEFDATQRYNTGAMVMHQNALYVCSRMYDPDFPEADFNTCFTATNVATQIASLFTSINVLRGSLDNTKSLICNQTFYPTTYNRGAVVEYGNSLYFCVQNHDASSYTYLYEDPYFVNCGTIGAGLLALVDSIAPICNPKGTYAVGDVVSVVEYPAKVRFYMFKSPYDASTAQLYWTYHCAEITENIMSMGLSSPNKLTSIQFGSQSFTDTNNATLVVTQSHFYKKAYVQGSFKLPNLTAGSVYKISVSLVANGTSEDLLFTRDIFFKYTDVNTPINFTIEGCMNTFLLNGQEIIIKLSDIYDLTGGGPQFRTAKNHDISRWFIWY